MPLCQILADFEINGTFDEGGASGLDVFFSFHQSHQAEKIVFEQIFA